MSYGLRGYDDWKTTETVEVCYHELCPHGHCDLCEGAGCCERCEIEAENLRIDAEVAEAQNRYEIRVVPMGGNQ